MLVKRVINKIKKIITRTIVGDWLNKNRFKTKLRKIQRHHLRELERLRSKPKVKVAFFLIHEAVWKYEGLYKLMDKDERFEPIVIICPYITYGDEAMINEMNKTYDSFKNEGYNVIKSFNVKNKLWLDIKKDIKPDIICFTNPWNVTRSEYCIENFLDKLTCYVPYGYKCSHLNNAHYNKPMQNFTWKFFIETPIHKKLAKKYAQNEAVNTVITGYPGMDRLLEKNQVFADPWKIKSKSLKRIIWAPHHSIQGYGAGLDYSTFMEYHNFFLKIAEKFKDKIQIAFKPHPILIQKLYHENVWGVEKTNEYFNRWKNLDNGILNDGDYINLFATSDAMFHDGASFLVDYLYTNNPVTYLVKDYEIKDRFNELGKKSFECHYHARNKDDIEKLIKMIISGCDDKVSVRRQFFDEYVKPPNHSTASENIYRIIKQSVH